MGITDPATRAALQTWLPLAGTNTAWIDRWPADMSATAGPLTEADREYVRKESVKAGLPEVYALSLCDVLVRYGQRLHAYEPPPP